MSPTKPIFCYWGTWSHYRTENGKFCVDDIDGSLCTHILYAFFGITTAGEIQFKDLHLDLTLNNIQKAVALKKKWPHLKIIASIGGSNEPSATFSHVAGSPQLRETFASNILNFLRQHGFDGVDIDWEHPCMNGGSSNDKENLVQLMRSIFTKLKPAGFEVMIATACAEDTIQLSYDLKQLKHYVDYALVMTYDMYGAWNKVTGHNAPLYPGPTINVETCVNNFLRQGFPSSKLILGIPFYGRTFVLQNAGKNGVGASTTGAGPEGPYTRNEGSLAYTEVLDRINKDRYKVMWDSCAMVPYAFSGENWISYDDVESVKKKAEFAKNNCGGVMVWTIDTDDAKGVSGIKYPMLKAINQILR